MNRAVKKFVVYIGHSAVTNIQRVRWQQWLERRGDEDEVVVWREGCLFIVCRLQCKRLAH
jgi:hypothetical protein